uniref:Uncharacterized protein n=1 Tax=Pseudomonas phage vB_PaeS_HTN2 TaxID=3236647 RepID=A0AB39AI50_9VIRU
MPYFALVFAPGLPGLCGRTCWVFVGVMCWYVPGFALPRETCLKTAWRGPGALARPTRYLAIPFGLNVALRGYLVPCWRAMPGAYLWLCCPLALFGRGTYKGG